MHENHIAKTELQNSTIYLSKDGEDFTVSIFRDRKPHVRHLCGDSKRFAFRVFFDQTEKEEQRCERLAVSV